MASDSDRLISGRAAARRSSPSMTLTEAGTSKGLAAARVAVTVTCGKACAATPAGSTSAHARRSNEIDDMFADRERTGQAGRLDAEEVHQSAKPMHRRAVDAKVRR